MALRMLGETEAARLMGCIIWVEDLEKNGLTYGDLLGFLDGLHMPCVCSMIHDRDTYTADDVRGWVKRHIDPDTGDVAAEFSNRTPKVGDPKKPHIHIYFCLQAKRQPRYMSKLFDDFIDGIVKPNRWALVGDFPGIVRYCAHLDQPDKAQYDPLLIHGFCNVKMDSLWQANTRNPNLILMEIETAIEVEKIPNYYRLNRWANKYGDPDIINMVKGRTAHWTAYFGAMRQEKQDAIAKRKAKEAAKEAAAQKES